MSGWLSITGRTARSTAGVVRVRLIGYTHQVVSGLQCRIECLAVFDAELAVIDDLLKCLEAPVRHHRMAGRLAIQRLRLEEAGFADIQAIGS